VVNKIDLPAARPEDVAMEIENLLAEPAENCIFTSAKTGDGLEDMMRAIVELLPPPAGSAEAATKALIFDSTYDEYRGVIVYVRVFDGRLAVGDKVLMMGTGQTYQVSEMGKFCPGPRQVKSLSAGEVGYVVANIRTVAAVHVGDTITQAAAPAEAALPGYRRRSRWSSATSTPGRRRSSPPCARRWKSSS